MYARIGSPRPELWSLEVKLKVWVSERGSHLHPRLRGASRFWHPLFRPRPLGSLARTSSFRLKHILARDSARDAIATSRSDAIAAQFSACVSNLNSALTSGRNNTCLGKNYRPLGLSSGSLSAVGCSQTRHGLPCGAAQDGSRHRRPVYNQRMQTIATGWRCRGAEDLPARGHSLVRCRANPREYTTGVEKGVL